MRPDHALIRRESRRDALTRAQISGFTMMELMAVVAVIAILATLSIPSYFDRIVRDQVKAALPLADVMKKPVETSWAGTMTFPANNAAAGLPVADKFVGNYVNAVAIEDGAIHITLGNRANNAVAGKILSLRPAVIEDSPVVPVAWVCGYAEAPNKMTVHGQNRTDVPEGLLPLECRALKR